MIYFIQNDKTGNIKIGYSTAVKTRLSDLGVGNDSTLSILKVLHTDNFVETLLHDKFNKFLIKGEWFSYNKDFIRFLEKIPIFDTKLIVDYINSFEFDKDTDSDISEIEESKYILKMNNLLGKLETAIVKSKNSGFTDGIRFAQKLIKQQLYK